MAAVLKTVDVYASVGSNPTSSAINVVRRGVREAEGARLLSGYGANHSIEGSNPSFSAIFYAPIAQLDRAFGYGPKGWRFESSWARHTGDDKRNRIYENCA